MKIFTGTDVETVSRFERLLSQESFLSGVFTEYERGYIAAAAHPAASAAGIYCAKEAAAKALGRGLFGLRPADICITHSETGAPQLALAGSAAQGFAGFEFSVSISHTGDVAVAVCTAYKENDR